MSSNDASQTRGNVGRDDRQSDMVAKLAKELDGALDLNNTEDVDTNTRYAPAVTKEVVKPVVHEKIEEHITRETHTHDYYTKILPVKDVEVLPARHWVPGPDGRLVQVDEKDVYSGAAFNQGQWSTASVTQDRQQVHFGQTNQDQVYQTRESSFGQSTDTVKHTSVNAPQVAPAQVSQVYQTQVHQPELDRQYVSVGQVDQSQISHGSHSSSGPVLVSHRDVNSGQAHQNQVDQLAGDHHQIPRKPVDQGQGYITPLHPTDRQTTVSENEMSSRHEDHQRHSHQPIVEHETGHRAYQGHSQPSTNRHEDAQRQVHNREVGHGQATEGQTHRERGNHQGFQHTTHHGKEDDSQLDRVSQQSVNQRQADESQNREHQINRDEPSPGLLDPYRVKNGPVHHDASDPMSKPLPDLPETSVQKIAGHKILTTEDGSGHTRLHKEPKDSNRTF